MGLFSGLEGNLEKYIEGFFKDKFKGRIQPVEIAKRLAREMRDKRRVSVKKTYVPNEYKVMLNPEDWESIGAFNKMLSLELQDYLEQKAKEKRFTLVAPPVVELEKNKDISAGDIELLSSFSEAIPLTKEELRQHNKNAFEDEEIHKTQMYKPVKGTEPIEKLMTAKYSLVVLEGRDVGKTFLLNNYRAVIGRKNTCDIVLTDPSVSRRHAQIDNVNDGYLLTDLNSTNGTLVGGVKVTKKLLQPKDLITFGTTVCQFKVD